MNEDIKCPECKKEMEFYTTEWEDLHECFMDKFVCYDCDEHFEVESEDQSFYEDPYREVERENCRNLL